MSVLQMAKDAFALIAQGKDTLAGIADAISDGRLAISATEKAQLDELLKQEAQESQAAHDKLADAIRAERGG